MTPDEAQTAIDAAFRMLRDADGIARLYGLGYGEQPACWPKHEQAKFAHAIQSGRLRNIMADLKKAYATIARLKAERDAAVAVSQAARDVLAERRRQVEVEGWTPEHDDAHDDGELALAAVTYALPAYQRELQVGTGGSLLKPLWYRLWPWGEIWWKPKDPRSDLVKAGALILAEIERLDRATPAAPDQGGARDDAGGVTNA